MGCDSQTLVIMILATIQFYTDSPSGWTVTRQFNDDSHMSNFIEYIRRTKGYNLDEVWIEWDKPNSLS